MVDNVEFSLYNEIKCMNYALVESWEWRSDG